MRDAMPKGATPRLKFVIPDINLTIDVETEVAWADLKGRAGFRFHGVAESTQNLLEKWLDSRMEKEFPGAKDRIATAQETLQ